LYGTAGYTRNDGVHAQRFEALIARVRVAEFAPAHELDIRIACLQRLVERLGNLAARDRKSQSWAIVLPSSEAGRAANALRSCCRAARGQNTS
jgi:hypothetical protein